MRASRDTFLHFLADNLPGLTVHPVRRDTNKPDSDLMQTNAVNVRFSNADFAVHVAKQTVVIDVIHEDELTALDMAQQVWNLLSTAFFTPKFDYASGSPVATGGTIFWDNVAHFRPVSSPMYYHFTCRLVLNHHI